MFKFVEIMLEMPEKPSWWQVVIKLAKVLAVMTIAYYGLMALYFAAEVPSPIFVHRGWCLWFSIRIE